MHNNTHLDFKFSLDIMSPHIEGLCGSPRITDVGGVPYLVPLVQKHKVASSVTKRAVYAQYCMVIM